MYEDWKIEPLTWHVIMRQGLTELIQSVWTIIEHQTGLDYHEYSQLSENSEFTFEWNAIPRLIEKGRTHPLAWSEFGNVMFHSPFNCVHHSCRNVGSQTLHYSTYSVEGGAKQDISQHSINYGNKFDSSLLSLVHNRTHVFWSYVF